MFAFMKQHTHQFAIEKMCKVLRVSRSGYYKWLQRKPSKRSEENDQLQKKIKTIFDKSHQRYGSPKITHELKKEGMHVSRPRVARMMKKMGLKSIVKKKYVVTTDSKHNFPASENLLNRQFSVDRPAEVWVSDITYIKVARGWMYLTVMLDLYDRKVVGWAMSESLQAVHTVIPAWKMAIRNRPTTKKLILHSDRGVQYACQDFRKILEAHPFVAQSMSRKGDCWDNAVAEAFFKILKSEMVNHFSFPFVKIARQKIFEFIEGWYNRERQHAYLGHLSPDEFYQKNWITKAT
ncbi:IS3 family transposase [Tunicatimonas pelagia]|uniref:IS3 family transposase n=1 Tax=Tunicatimonas pelagia TaxID=931531 RepID=UPI003F53F6B5